MCVAQHHKYLPGCTDRITTTKITYGNISMNNQNSPEAPSNIGTSIPSHVVHTINRGPSFLLIFVVSASIAANLYLANKLWNGEKPIVFSPVTDQHVVMRTSGGLLEVSTIKASEQFDVSKDHTFLGIPLGNTATHIRVPVVYRYHIELAPDWRILLRDKTFIVVAPPVKPSLPVAMDTTRLETRSSGAWSFFTGKTQLVELEKSITPSLATKAASPVYIQLQREAARKTTAEFVAKWLITQERWKSASAFPIHVFFADEPIQALGNMPPP